MLQPIKIPIERLFELDKKLYLITISVEGVEQVRNNRFEKGDDDDDQDDEDAQDDDCDDLLDDEQEMEMDKTVESAAKSDGSRGRQLTCSNVKFVSCGQAENQVEEAAPDQLQQDLECSGGSR
jgi:flagellar biosynthesis/type III secretory pathway M-ring protein FliF/YscJ